MSLVSLTLPNDGETIDASDVNVPFNAIASVINGQIDDTNINNVSGTKINPGTLPYSALNSAAQTMLSQSWFTLPSVPTSITYNGQRSYDMTFSSDQSSILSPGYRLKVVRSTPSPTQSASLNGTTQYFNKTSPAGMTFTDDFVVSAWIKLSSYSAAGIVTRYNGTSGWRLAIGSAGQVSLEGYNGGAGNISYVLAYQAIPLNRWVHIAAQLDMSAFTATGTTSYIMIDGVDVPVQVVRGGTNPTALVQAGNLEIGGNNGGVNPFPGKIAQVAIYNAKVTQANIRATISQGLVGNETSLISAYSLSNSLNDLSANANNLTANGSATTTNADAPWGQQVDGTISSTVDYGIIQSISGTSVTYQVAEGNTVPTSGGIASVKYATTKSPYGMPMQKDKWRVTFLSLLTIQQASATNDVWYNVGSYQLKVPTGAWVLGYSGLFKASNSSNIGTEMNVTLSTTNNGTTDIRFNSAASSPAIAGSCEFTAFVSAPVVLQSLTPYYLNMKKYAGSGDVALFSYNIMPITITAENAYL